MAEPEAPQTADEFYSMVGAIEMGADYEQPAAFALGLATVESDGEADTVLDVQLTRRNYETSHGAAAVLAAVLDQKETGLRTGEYLLTGRQLATALELLEKPFKGQAGHGNIDTLNHLCAAQDDLWTPDRLSGSSNPRRPVLTVVRDWEDAPETVGDAYLRLYALSERIRQPNTINLDGVFGMLPNVVMTEQAGTFSVDKWNATAEQLAYRGVSTAVRGLDKFPRMLDHVVPTGVRVADPSRVRLGAHLGQGTTVMHEGFVNFNAGTLGKAMVEGRISAGVVVGDETDIGGGASIMGTLSGGNKEKITIGKRCLLEANSGIGISLGDDCRVEAGVYIKSTTPVTLPKGEVMKAAHLSGEDNILLRRNARTGTVELVRNDGGEWGGLNADLHRN